LSSRLEAALARGKAVVGVVGLGYVGMPLARWFNEVGLEVLGFDVDEQRVAAVNLGRSPIRHVGDDAVRAMRARGFEATADYARIGEVDALVVCVPTPLDPYRQPDLQYVEATLASALPHLRPGQLLSLESTTWPGTTEEILRPRLEAQGFTIGEDFFLVYSPEREDPGNPVYTTRNIPKLVAGSTPACHDVGRALYGRIVDEVVAVGSTRVAEMAKLLENIQRAVNIGLVNEMKLVCERMGLDIFDVVRAAATKPFGFQAYEPGPGIGGHCIPVDPFYLTWKAREFGLHTRFIELAGEINAAMPRYVLDRLVEALNARGKALKGARVLVLGIAYKRHVDDVRESPCVEVMEILRAWGAEVRYSDPYVPLFPRMRRHRFELTSVPVDRAELERSDAVLVLTDHDDFDYELVLAHAPLVVDTRGRYAGSASANIVRA
jgi:UDP-N-acetyl-D-glucosamine dehydrogenase